MEEIEKIPLDELWKNIASYKYSEDPERFRQIVSTLLDAKVFVPESIIFDSKTGWHYHMKAGLIVDRLEKMWFPVFTSKDEGKEAGNSFHSYSWVAADFIYCCRSALSDPECAGIVIDPFTVPLELPRAELQVIIR